MFGAITPTDFIEEIWVRDIVDLTWTMVRLRRLQTTFWTIEVSEDADREAATLAEAEYRAAAETGLMEETEKEEMTKLLDGGSDLSWEMLVEQNPRANEKFQELYSAARSTLDMNAIQAKVMLDNFYRIEQIDNLIMIAQRRIDEVIRELDRHRIMQNQRHGFHDRDEARFETVQPKLIVGRVKNAKVA